MSGEKHKLVVIGAGPAGLSSAYEMLEKSGDWQVTVLEASPFIGGISRTVERNGNRFDIGPHRFFSKSDEVNALWDKLMPRQGAPAKDDVLLNRRCSLAAGGPDPEKTDRVMLRRHRLTRIFYLKHFFDYPISIKPATFLAMGLVRTWKAAWSYLYSMFFKRPEKSLEDFYINRFGKVLYSMFFEDYTEKVWGVHPSRLGADWGSQRVKGLSVTTVIKDMIAKKLKHDKSLPQKEVETSLIEQFIYPKHGPGQLWETVAEEIRRRTGEVVNDSEVKTIHVEGNRVTSVDVCTSGTMENHRCDHLLSSMPIKDLVAALRGIEVPAEVRDIASRLAYRDFITVGLLVKTMKIKNKTKIATYDNRIPDTWVYVQERDVKIGRMQIFNNWSPYMVQDLEKTVWIGMEYFANEGDELWEASDEDFIAMANKEICDIKVVSEEDILDATRIRVKKAYPAYFDSYHDFPLVKAYLDTIDNLYCVGRNGQHRYNNMDHSILTALTAVRSILDPENVSKEAVWEVNTEKEYHETKAK